MKCVEKLLETDILHGINWKVSLFCVSALQGYQYDLILVNKVRWDFCPNCKGG